MNLWKWFGSKPVQFDVIFGELSNESARLFYELHFKSTGYKTIDVSLPEEIRHQSGYDFGTVESFDFPDRPIKQRDHWILGSHMELDTPTIIVDHDYKIMLEDLGIDGLRDRIFLADHFKAFLDYIVTGAK